MTPPGTPGGAVILGAEYRALGVARSLGRRGVPVWVLSEPAEPLAATSRYVRRSIRWPEHDHMARVDFLCEIADRHGLDRWALIPSSDEAAALVARHHDRLARHYSHTIPSWEVTRWAYDKRLTYELADRAGVPRPRTVQPQGQGDAAVSAFRFPAVLKPAVKESFNSLTAAKAWLVKDAEHAKERIAEAQLLVPSDVLMLQELVPGGGEAQFSYAALCRDGEPLATLMARRTRQYPADFGRASTFVETVDDPPELAHLSERLLRELSYSGLIEVEFKRDRRDGVLKLLDVNPRVWGWHSLCARAGVDFPWLLWLLISGRPVPRVRARPGVGWLRLTTDTPTAIRELVARRLPMREYARSLRSPRERAIFAWDDPLPGVAEVPLMAYVLARRLLGGGAV